MTGRRGPFEKLIDTLKDGLAEVLGELAPRPDLVPIPIRDDPRRRG